MNNSTRSNIKYQIEDLNFARGAGSSNTGLIIGVVVGILILVALGVGLYNYKRRKLRSQLDNQDEALI